MRALRQHNNGPSNVAPLLWRTRPVVKGKEAGAKRGGDGDKYGVPRIPEEVVAILEDESLEKANLEPTHHTALDHLQEMESKFRLLFEQSMDAVAVVAVDGTLLDANPAYLRLFGLDGGAIGHINVRDFYVEAADRAEFLRRMEQYGAVQDDDVRLKKVDGTVMDCLRTAIAIRDETGRIVAFQSVVRDVTEQKRRKDALADELARRRILLEQSRDGIVVLEQDGKVAEANRSFAQMLGYSPEELLQLHVWDWDASFPPETLVEMLRTVDESGDHFETRHRRKDGTAYDVEISTNGAVFSGQKLVFCVCRDITGRKKAEAALRESEDEYRSLFEVSMDAVYVNAADGSHIRANQAWLDLFGYSRDELQDLNIIAFYANPEEREDSLRRIAGPGVLEDEMRFKKKDGTVMDGIRSVVVRKDEYGNTVAYQGVIRDITEQKRSQQALKESEEKFRLLFEQSMDAVAVVAVDGTLLDANPAYLRLFGLDDGAIGHVNVRDFYVGAADRDEFLRTMEQYGAIQDEEVRRKKADGTVMDCLRTAIAMRDETGRIVGFQTVIRDVTEQKRAQQALKESEEKYRTLFELIGDAININAPDGTLLDVNQAFHDLLGYTREDISSFNTVDAYANPADREDFLRRMAKTGFVKDVVRFRRKDGSVFDCERTAVARKDESGAVVAYLGINRDITERKRMEERLAEANRELRELAARLEAEREEERAAVAWELHDEVGQALSVVNMDLDSLRGKLPPATPVAAHAVLDRAAGVLNDTVARLRRLYTDLIPVMLEDLGLAATIEWQAEEFARVSGVGCELRRVEDIKLPRARMALGMFRVLQEALDNVRRHSGATKVTVDFEREGGDAVLRVADNGRGFAEDEARKPGAIGLTGIRERVLSWGGRMSVNTSVGAGTVLEVTVPLEDEPPVTAAPESPDT